MSRSAVLANVRSSLSCSVADCDADGLFISGTCQFHSALTHARELSPEEFDRLRGTLSTTAPITDDERRQRRGRSALREIEWKARDLKSAKRRARDAGVTEGQIADAVKRGKAEAR